MRGWLRNEEDVYRYCFSRKKDDVQSYTDNRGIKMMSLTMRIWERVVEARPRRELITSSSSMAECQRKSIKNRMFGLRVLMDNYERARTGCTVLLWL